MNLVPVQKDRVRIRVFCQFRFEGFHCWPKAPPAVEFLRDLHRHVFHVRAELSVDHHDRDVEFILLKRAMQEATANKLEEGETRSWSCERWALWYLNEFRLDRCEVSEDGENGAIVTREDVDA